MHSFESKFWKHLAILILLLLAGEAKTQYYLSGQDASSVRWKRIKSDHFTIIFPNDYASEANRIARLLETSYPILRATYEARAKSTPVIIHPHSVIPNASAAWAPRRMDFYQTSPQDGYSQDWMKQLSLHELRHIVQFSTLDKGFGKLISALSGQQGTAAVMGAFVPLWFIEGDAVTSETIFSSSGRGRQTRFSAGLKAQLQNLGAYSYGKAYFGSYKDHVPDIYELGYHLVAYNQMKFGDKLWHTALDRTAKQPWRIKPFTSGIRKVSGMNKNQLYKTSMAGLNAAWKNQNDAMEIQTTDYLSPVGKVFTNYKSPRLLKNGNIVALKNSMDDISAIVLLDSQHETIVHRPGIMLHDWLSARDSLIVWAEFQPDERWSNVSYSVIKSYSLSTKKTRQLTCLTRYFAPDLSADNATIAAVEQGKISGSSLVIIDLQSLEVKQRYAADDMTFQTPRWNPDATKVFFTAIADDGKAIFEWQPDKDSVRRLTPFTFTDFALSQVTDEGILLQGDWHGTAGIFFWRFSTQTLEMLTERPYSAIDPAFDHDGNLVFSDYSANGYRVASLPGRVDIKQPVPFEQQGSFLIADQLSHPHFNLDTVLRDTVSYHSEKYNRLLHLFDFHSWSPVHIDANNQELSPGISLFSQNALSTMVTELGYKYDMNEQTGKYIANLTYLGWYPELTFGMSHGLRKGVAVKDDQPVELKWKETDLSFGAVVPLNFSKGIWLRGARTSISFRHLYRNMEAGIPLRFKQSSSDMLSYSTVLYNQRRMAKRDLYPRYGQVVQLVFRHSPFDADPADQFFAGGVFYLPGFIKNHGFKLYASYQKENTGFVSFGNLAAIPRGYAGINASTQTMLKLDYAAPLFYPDFDLPTIMYLKRIKAYFFADYLKVSSGSLFSSGVEIMSDWHFFNLPAPVNIGLRISYRDYYQDVKPELLFGINFDDL